MFFRMCAFLCAFCMIMSSCSDSDDEIIPQPGDSEGEHLPCVCPDFLKPGDSIAVVSPAYWTDMETIELGMSAIEAMGFTPVLAPNVGSQYLEKYAGTTAQRVADLEWAYAKSGIKAIMTTRGGYGCIQMLQELDKSVVQDNPKWLIGYSDITTLLSYSVTSGVMAIHGTMLSSLKKTGGTSDDDQMLRELLLGNVPDYEWAATTHRNRTGEAHGVVVGGNMSTFTPLIGSPYDFTSQGDLILFVEEIGENARNIDRMMYSLKIHGTLSRVKGIIVGDFAGCGDEFKIGSIEEMLDKYTLSGFNIPIAYGFKAGHAGINMPLVMGAEAILVAEDNKASLKFAR